MEGRDRAAALRPLIGTRSDLRPSVHRRSPAPWALGAVGLLMTFHPTLFSAFETLQDVGPDAQMIHYLLEHTFLWLDGRPSHESVWSPPIFFPHPNTAAYTESNLGVAPFYLAWRGLGLTPETSYQLFLMALLAANYAAVYAFLRVAAGLAALPAACGAFLFAFGNSRVARLPHANLVCHVYVVLALLAVCRIHAALAREPDDRDRCVRRWIAVLVAALVLQAYAGYYSAFFLGLALAGVLLGSLAFGEYRRTLLTALRRHKWAGAISLAAGGLALLPLALPYRRALSELGGWRYEDFAASLPGIDSWLFMGRRNWLYGAWSAAAFFEPSVTGLRNVNGFGYLTALVCAWGFWRHRQRASVRLMVLVAALLVALAFRFPGGFSLWEYVHRWTPGAQGIRSVGRIGMLLLVPASVGLALALELWLSRGRGWLAAVVMLVVAVEQVNVHDTDAKTLLRERYLRLASRVPAGCRAFYFCGAVQGRRSDLDSDALWIQAASHVPTVNGRGAKRPPGWRLEALRAPERMTPEAVRADLESWLSGKGLDAADVCVLIEDTQDDRRRGRLQGRGGTPPGSP
jgi:hypothetical protein